jgi:L-rhamnose mutarotase
MRKLYFALDLHNDPALIAEYERWHRAENIWPEVLDGLRARGVKELELFRCGNRLIQVLEVDTEPDAVAASADRALESRTEDWEQLMWKFQLALPFAAPGEKWVPMRRIFSFRQALLGQDCEPEE